MHDLGAHPPLECALIFSNRIGSLILHGRGDERASCGAITAMEIPKESIAIKIIAPMEPHVRAYITVGGLPL